MRTVLAKNYLCGLTNNIQICNSCLVAFLSKSKSITFGIFCLNSRRGVNSSFWVFTVGHITQESEDTHRIDLKHSN